MCISIFCFQINLSITMFTEIFFFKKVKSSN